MNTQLEVIRAEFQARMDAILAQYATSYTRETANALTGQNNAS